MQNHPVELLFRTAERRALVMVIRSHPEWTLEHIISLVEHGGERAVQLAALTVGDLLAEPEFASPAPPSDPSLPLDSTRLAVASKLVGAEFDECVHAVIVEAGRKVGAAYLRARVGGPRWKLQASLGRLLEAGAIERAGVTNGTCYWARQSGLS